MSSAHHKKITYRYERFRAITAGILETAGITFLLLIALRAFDAGPIAKGIIAGGGGLGLMLSPMTVAFVGKAGWSPSKAASRISAIGAVCYLIMAFVPWLPVYIVGSVLALTATSCAIPLLTQMYQENYPEVERGQLFSRTVMIRIAVAAAFSELGGRMLSYHLELYRVMLVIFAVALAFGGFCLSRIPTRPLSNSAGSHPFRALRFAHTDKLFRRTLVCWMFMGFANLMMLPMRVEYLGNAKYELGLSLSMVALLTGVIPNVARLILSPVWGWLFDKMNFFALRMTLNVGFMIGIVSFFTSNDLPGLITGAIIFGISNAGGDVAWSLWVTKFSPHDRVAEYMAVHTFFTGVRGVLAPLAGFYLVAHLSMGALGWIAAALILIATLLLLPELRQGRRGKPGSALVEEVTD